MDAERYRKLDVGTPATEIPGELRDAIVAWMTAHLPEFQGADDLDFAVECAYTMELVDPDQDYEIPLYIMELAKIGMAASHRSKG